NASRERCCGSLRNAINARKRCKRRELKARRRRPSKMISTAPSSRTSNRAGGSPPTPLVLLGMWLLQLRSSSESPLSPLACVDNKPTLRAGTAGFVLRCSHPTYLRIVAGPFPRSLLVGRISMLLILHPIKGPSLKLSSSAFHHSPKTQYLDNSFLCIVKSPSCEVRQLKLVAPKPISTPNSQFVFCSVNARFVLTHARTFEAIRLRSIREELSWGPAAPK